MSAPHQSHEARLAFRRWEVSVWQHLLDVGHRTTDKLYASGFLEGDEDATKQHLSRRLREMRCRGMLTSNGTKHCKWKAVQKFNVPAYLYCPALEQQAAFRQSIYNHLRDFGPSSSSQMIKDMGGDMNRIKLWYSLECMQKLDMLNSELVKNKRVYSVKPDFDMLEYMDSIPKPPQPEPVHTDSMAGLRLEEYVPDALDEDPPEFVGPRYCPDVATPRHNDIFTTTYRPKPWVNPRG